MRSDGCCVTKEELEAFIAQEPHMTLPAPGVMFWMKPTEAITGLAGVHVPCTVSPQNPPRDSRVCYNCGSSNLVVQKCKVVCDDCKLLIENCNGD